jgi:branched-chain amino acid transport system substrate-binding protein
MKFSGGIMKNLKWVIGILVVVVILGVLLTVGCTSKTTTGGTTTQATSTSTSGAKVLKIGVNQSMKWSLGLDTVHLDTIMADLINSKGGLTIGGQKYLLQLVIDENDMTADGAKTVIQKQVYEDKVKYILDDGNFYSPLQITEPNKVLYISGCSTDFLMEPNIKYAFKTDISPNNQVSVAGWYLKAHPGAKTIVFVTQDRETGHTYAKHFSAGAEAFGAKVLDVIYYPTTLTDLSSIGTKVAQLNPDIVETFGVGPTGDANCYKACRQAGYKGVLLNPDTAPAETLAAIAGVNMIEGMVGGAQPTEFDPAPTEASRAVKAAYIAKYGKWDNPEILWEKDFEILIEAMKATNSVDPEVLAAWLGAGNVFTISAGNGRFIPRPDITSSPRSAQLILDNWIKTVVNGKPVNTSFSTWQEVYEFVRPVYNFPALSK